METWKTCVQAPAYEVSDMGRVRRRLPGQRTRPGKIVKGQDPGYGYIQVLLSIAPCKYRQFLVHRLVMAAFVGPSDLVVNHKNGKRADNRLSNLEYVTYSQNMIHARDVLGTYGVGARNGRAKLRDADIKLIVELHESGISQRELGRRFKVSDTAIWNIIHKRAWTHLAADPRPPKR